MSEGDLSDKIYAAKMEFAKAEAVKVVSEHNRTMILSAAKNVIAEQLQVSEGKVPSEQKIERLARDTKEYDEAVTKKGDSLRAAIEAEAKMEKFEREYEMAMLG